MGARGPVSMPDNVRQLRGETRPSQQSRQPMPVRGVPSQPAFLDPEAKAEWKRVTPELRRLGLLAHLDRAILSTYCEAWAVWVDAAKARRTDDSSMAWRRYRDSSRLVSDLATALGLTPNARGRMKAPDPEDSSPELD